ncbi:DUF4019 domain-containing protein [Luteimonas aestuarii]|nr:DUF4019 domain-containing protein [Luteimonas aestuarii]
MSLQALFAMGLPRRVVGRLAVGVAMVVSGSHALAQDVQSIPRGENGYELRIELGGVTSLEDAQEALWPHAQRLCGDRAVQYGQYRYDAIAPLAGTGTDGDRAGHMALVQALECVGDAGLHEQEAPAFVPAPLVPPTPEDEAAVRDLSVNYLSAVDEDRFADAFAMMSPSFRPIMAQGNWRETRGAFNSKVESQAVRQIVRLTWYDDPAGAPTPGRYVAADYRGDHAGGAFYCGYLVWLLQADGSYRLVRSEEGMLSGEEARRIPAGMRATVRAQLQCRD